MNLLQSLLLLLVANGAPVVAWKLFGTCCQWPVDGGLRLGDGRPLLGAGKTFRGLLASTITCTLVAPLVGLDIVLGALVAASAMAGDLLSSFIKRRAGVATSGMAVGLDQIPEALLPLLVLRGPLALTWFNVGLLVGVFILLELLLSRLLFRLHLRKRPY